MKRSTWILFFVSLSAVLNIGNTFRIAQILTMVKEFEPVVVETVECNHSHDPEPAAVPEVISETEVIPEPEPEQIPIRITCPLDDDTQQMILDKCEEYEIDFAFTMAVIFTESSFRTLADSGSSVGLMQINRINHEWLSKELGITNFFDPEQNVTAGLYMLRELFDKYDDPASVLMAYNMGEYGASKLWKKGVYTTAYVEKVFQYADKYNAEIAERMGEK